MFAHSRWLALGMDFLGQSITANNVPNRMQYVLKGCSLNRFPGRLSPISGNDQSLFIYDVSAFRLT